MPRFKTKTSKRSKRSRIMKNRWIRQRQAVRVTPVILDDSIENPDVMDGLCSDKENENIGNILRENEDMETMDVSPSELSCEDAGNLIINPLWCKNVYSGPGPSTPVVERSQEYGVIPSDECESIENEVLECQQELSSSQTIIEGNRIVELGYVIEQILLIGRKHNGSCTLGKLQLKQEIRKCTGLVSKIILNCHVCNRSYSFDTEDPDKKQSEVNLGCVWGTLATGSTYSHTSELLSCMNIPNMPQKQFQAYENKLGEVWKASLWESMEDAGRREKEHAIEVGNICADGIPWTTVYVDGSWSKRSYGSNYSALSGMIGIIGQYTGEVLFIGVRNKFCSICARAENKHLDPEPHICFKNWSGSTTSMEADLAVEGFKLSIEMHGIRYCKFIGDGDSSVFVRIKENVPYGSMVKKIECTNHALKNYGKHLREIKKDTSINLEGRKLPTLSHIDKLTRRAKCSIYEHSKMQQHNVQLLKEDLENGLNHVFGDHTKCRQGICNIVGDQSNNKVPQLKSFFIYHHIKGALNLLARKAHLLIENENNNRAERLMNIVARFNMGKRLNLVQRGSYERRVYLSGLRYNQKLNWHINSWKKVTGSSRGKYFKTFIESGIAKQASDIKNRQSLHVNKSLKRTVSTPNIDYGHNVDEPDVDPIIVEQECQNLIRDLQVDEHTRNRIAAESVGQFGNEVYEHEREKRLTASLFGRVINKRDYTPCHNIVKSCLKPTSFHSDATLYGHSKESVAIALFEKKTGLVVDKSGLWIDLTHGFLAASPDGLIGSDALIEVKCLYSSSHLRVSTIDEVLEKNKKTCLITKNNKISLKKKHPYYYQVQGQLNICKKRPKCYFVVYINDHISLHIEEIFRDTELWEQKMLPKLIQFYKECVGPEVIRGNLLKNKKCIDPPFILNAIKARNTNLKKKNKKRAKKDG